MKKLFMLAVVLVMTCTIAFAASQTPYAKAKSFGKQLITLAFNEDDAGIERLTTQVESYIENNIDTEEQLVSFLEGLEAGLREGCRNIGLSEEETEEVIIMMGDAILAGMLEELEGY